MKDENNIRQEVIASLEGARVVIAEGVCQLDEYDFVRNCWNTVQQDSWPLSRAQAAQWLHGWNKVDGFKALNLLICPEPD